MTAVNSAGESAPQTNSIWMGQVTSEPIEPKLVAVTPDSTLTIGWKAPLTSNCLSILSYTVAKNGIELSAIIDPSENSFTDDISIGGSIGQLITYKVLAIN